MRLRGLAMVGVALAPVLGMAASADAGEGKGWRKVHVTFSQSGPGPTLPPDVFCDGAAPEICGFLVKFPDVRAAGDLVGTTIEADSSVTSTSGLHVVNVSGSFAGSVKDCGTGSFLYSGHGILNANLEGSLAYQVAAGTGTDDLEGITGRFAFNDDGSISGVLRCRRR